MTEIVLFVVGILVGAMNSIAGGGMLIGFPVLLATGMPALVANATSNIIVLPGQLASAIGYRKYLRRIPAHYLLLIIPCIVGALAGAIILRNTSQASFEKFVPILIVFAVALFAFQPFLHDYVHRHMHGPVKHRRSLRPLVVIAFATVPLSIYGGYFGVGFGFIMLAFLGFSRLHEIHQMNALKNVMSVCISAASIVVLFSTHLIDWRHGAPMMLGNIVGGYCGAIGAQKVSSHAIRVVVIVIGVVTAGYLVFRSYSL